MTASVVARPLWRVSLPESGQFLVQEAILVPQTLAKSGKIGLSLLEIGIDFGLMYQIVRDGTVDLFQRQHEEAVNDALR